MKKHLLLFVATAVFSLSSCTSMKEYTAIAKSDLTKEMLENRLRLPQLTEEGLEQNVVMSSNQICPIHIYLVVGRIKIAVSGFFVLDEVIKKLVYICRIFFWIKCGII